MSKKLEVITFNPSRPDFEDYGLTCCKWHPSLMLRPDYHNEVELNFLESGSVTYLFGGDKIHIEAGKFTAFWAAIPHQVIDCSESANFFVATIPLRRFLSDPNTQKAEYDEKLFEQWAIITA